MPGRGLLAVGNLSHRSIVVSQGKATRLAKRGNKKVFRPQSPHLDHSVRARLHARGPGWWGETTRWRSRGIRLVLRFQKPPSRHACAKFVSAWKHISRHKIFVAQNWASIGFVCAAFHGIYSNRKLARFVPMGTSTSS
jgi:hypothetical protein